MSMISEEARALHADAIVIDGCSFFSQGWHERLAIAGVTALQMTVPWPGDDFRRAVRRYQHYYRLVNEDARLGLVTSTEDIRQFKREGRVGFILGSQDADILETDPGLVEVYHRLGVRVIQISYNERNLLADGCLEPTNAGLSRFGKAVIREMNRVGIQVDLSHVGERSSLEAMDISTKPCIFSHSNPKARADNPRNITDEQIRRCAETGGVIGLSPWPPICWTGGPNPPSLDDLIGHIEYVVDLVGIDHVAIGTDSEATPGAYPKELRTSLGATYGPVTGRFQETHPGVRHTAGFESMEGFPNLTAALLERGWRPEDVRKLLGENLLRVYRESWGA